MKRFAYLRPGNMEDAIAALQANDEPYLLAGGTDLLIAMKTKAVKPKCLIDLKGIPGIDSIEYDNGSFGDSRFRSARVARRRGRLWHTAGAASSHNRRQPVPWVSGGGYGRHSSGNELRSKNCQR